MHLCCIKWGKKCTILHLCRICMGLYAADTLCSWLHSPQCNHGCSNLGCWCTCLEKIPISQGLVTLLHICGVVPTLQLPISPETMRWVPSVDIATPNGGITDVATSSADIVASNDKCASVS